MNTKQGTTEPHIKVKQTTTTTPTTTQRPDAPATGTSLLSLI